MSQKREKGDKNREKRIDTGLGRQAVMRFLAMIDMKLLSEYLSANREVSIIAVI